MTSGKTPDRVLLLPVGAGARTDAQLVDWYSANVKNPRDRLVFVRILIPDEEDSSLLSASSSCSTASSTQMEEQMERQLAESVSQEERLVSLLHRRGIRSFRFIHAFGRHFADTLVRIAAEQAATVVLAPLSTMSKDADVSYALEVYRRSGLGFIHAPDPV